MRPHSHMLLATVCVLALLLPGTSQGSDKKLKQLKAEAVTQVEMMRVHTQQMVDMIFSFGELGFQEIETSRYITDMLDPSIDWLDVEKMVAEWDGQFCLKGIMSVEDARKAVDIGCTGIVISNHGGRQLDGSRSPFDQLDEIVNAVGDKIDILMDSGIQRGTHVLKALSLGAKAVGVGRLYLYPLAAGGQAGVERVLELMRMEIERDLCLMGCSSLDELSPKNLRFR